MESIIRRAASAIAIMICLAVCDSIARADVKIKAKSTQGSTVSEQTTYIKGRRQRTEMANGMMISVMQCDLQRSLQIMPQTKSYIVTQFNQPAQSADRPSNQPRAKETTAVRGGVITTTITTKDTGERKKIFGYPARHLIMTMTTESSPDACSKIKTKMEVDAWYIDFTFGLDCDMSNAYQGYNPATQSGCQDRNEVKQVGPAAKGYPVWTKTTMFDESGNPSFSMEQEVIEISQATLDAALFDAPADYREVKSFSGAYSGETNRDIAKAANEDSGIAANVKSAASKQADNVAREVGPKKAGVVRFGLVAVKTGSVGDALNAAELAAAVQNTMAQALKSPNVELVTIEASQPSLIDAEAKKKECDFVIYTNVEHKKGGSRFASFAPALSGVTGLGGVGGSTAGAVAGSVASAEIITAAEVSQDVKAKDQLTLDVKLQAPGNATAAVERQFKAKAQSNGEDIISPTVQQAAQAILIAAAKV
ncbi:MAG TPA: DUF4412 domain-containing protein [Blastocatellia bacterium]|nr:DUF4412 domain-containing protein [Blastocatellia bacterium]